MNAMLANAIEKMMVLEIEYNGGTRIIEPHCYGEGTKGQELLRCYQTSGYSESGKMGWKLMRVEDIGHMGPTGDSFSRPREGYNPNGDKAIPTVFAML